MAVNLKSNPDGTSGAIQINGVDVLTFNSTGLVTGAVSPSGVQTLTNKTMDFNSNTFTNFPPSTPFASNAALAQSQAIALSF